MKTQKRFNVVIDQIEKSYICRGDQHLLAGMSSLGIRGLCTGCHGGGCGVCKIHVLQGEVEVLVMSREHISEAEQQAGIYLACRVFPRSDIRLKVTGKLSKKVLNPCAQKKYGFV